MYIHDVVIGTEGYLFSGTSPLRGPEIKSFFKDVTGFESFCQCNNNVNGVYSVYFQFREEAFLYVSPGGFQKLFYSIKGGVINISAKAETLSEGVLNEEVFPEYRASLFCWGNATLFKDVYAVEPGCAIWISKAGVERRKIYSYSATPAEIRPELWEVNLNHGKKAIDHAFDNMMAYLGQRQAVVPLSGGFDSRLILAQLVQRGCKNIVAVTYGTPGNLEVEIAEKVTKILNVKWYFVAYTEAELRKTFDTFDIDHYISTMVNGNSFCNMHEIIAVSWLKSNGLIDPDAVFIPGHSGDFLGGSQYVKVFPPFLKYRHIASRLVAKKFEASLLSSFNRRQKKLDFSQRINRDYKSDTVPATIFEDIDMAEKLCKHILNAAHAYTYFGYDCYFPYWDMNLLNTFSLVPDEFKIGKSLYNELLHTEYFEILKINFEEELEPTLLEIGFQNIKNEIKRFLPEKVKKYYARKNDYFLYHQITQGWRHFMEEKGFLSKYKNYSYNSIIANWVVFKLKNQVKSSKT